MATVHVDTIQEGELVRTRDKISLPVIYKLSGVTGSTAAAKKFAALGDSSIPAINAVHPTYTNLRVAQQSAKIDDSLVEVTVTYESVTTATGGNPDTPTVPVYELSAVANVVSTNHDKNGTLIELGPTDQRKVGSVSVHKPAITVRVSRVEVGVNPGNVAQAYVGKVNSQTWLSQPAGYWLMTGLQSRTSDSGLTTQMNYDFELAVQPLKPDGTAKTIAHNPIAYWKDSATGEGRPGTQVEGTDWKEVLEYSSVDFNTLSI